MAEKSLISLECSIFLSTSAVFVGKACFVGDASVCSCSDFWKMSHERMFCLDLKVSLETWPRECLIVPSSLWQICVRCQPFRSPTCRSRKALRKVCPIDFFSRRLFMTKSIWAGSSLTQCIVSRIFPFFDTKVFIRCFDAEPS